MHLSQNVAIVTAVCFGLDRGRHVQTLDSLLEVPQ